MTDNEIIKALECCKGYLSDHCIGCRYVEKYPQCTNNLREYTLDLINRQKAEIERLEKELNKYPIKTVVNNNCEIHSKTSKDYDNLMADFKSEAIKDFADRLKERRGLNQMCIAIVSKNEIDNIVKQMTEDKENEQDV